MYKIAHAVITMERRHVVQCICRRNSTLSADDDRNVYIYKQCGNSTAVRRPALVRNIGAGAGVMKRLCWSWCDETFVLELV